MAKVIVCADDYAQSAAIDAAIIQLIQNGILTATSAMTLSPHWPQAAKQLTADIRQQADIGLHLDFTQFSHGLYGNHPTIVLSSLLRALDATAALHNIRQQLEAFEQALGTPPDYIDGHLHVHQLPQIRDALMAELQTRYAHLPPAQRPWLRISSPPQGSGLKARLIHWLGAKALRHLALKAGLRVSPCLLGVYDFRGDVATYQAHWLQWAQQVKQYPSAEWPPVLMCHPAQATTEPEAADPIAHARVVEWRLLSSPAFKDWLKQSDIVPVKGSQCTG